MARLATAGALLLLLAVAAVAAPVLSADVVVRSAKRRLDATTHLLRAHTALTVANTGKAPLAAVHFAVEEAMNAKQWMIEAADEQQRALAVAADGALADKHAVLYKLTLAAPLAAGAEIEITVKQVFVGIFEAYPAEIRQADHQKVRFIANHHTFLAYRAESETTEIKLATAVLEPGTAELAPMTVNGDTISCGAYEDVPAFSVSPFTVHFENDNAFLMMSSMAREIEVSHWGNVAVEESFVLHHTGAKLRGSFSRYDFQRFQGQNSFSAVGQFKCTMLPGAADVYYRDEIGNISTSAWRGDQELTMRPRFLMFGGWKTASYMGYNVPLASYLSYARADSSLYTLNITFAPNYENVPIDDYVLRVILPEGASGIEVHTPFAVDSETRSLHFTYLDTTGRPVVVLRKSHVLPEHAQYFQVTYHFASTGMLREPMLVMLALLALFVAGMVYVRFELPLSRDAHEAEEQREARLQEALRNVGTVRTELESVFEAMDALLPKLAEQKRGDVAMQYTAYKTQVERACNRLLDLVTALREIAPGRSTSAKQLRDLTVQRAKAMDKLFAMHSDMARGAAAGGADAAAAAEQTVQLRDSYRRLKEKAQNDFGDLRVE